MSGYKVFYFNFRGRAEPIRFILSYANVDFEDLRHEEDEWPALKESMPFGKVPAIEIDGVKYGQSYAICRYLGKKLDLGGANDLEDLEIDASGLFLYDMVGAAENMAYYYTQSLGDNLKKEVDKLINETYPYFLTKFEAIVLKNNGHFFRGKFSWLDFYFAGCVEYILIMMCMVGKREDAQKMFENFPNLKKLNEKVRKQDGIRNYVEKRPNQEY